MLICAQAIDQASRVENDFFPAIAGELGGSFEDSANLQKRLHDFIPTFQVSFSVLLSLHFALKLLQTRVHLQVLFSSAFQVTCCVLFNVVRPAGLHR